METHVDSGMFFKELDERQIGVLVGLLEDMAEIWLRRFDAPRRIWETWRPEIDTPSRV
jgi:hypothetical protein